MTIHRLLKVILQLLILIYNIKVILKTALDIPYAKS